VLGLHTESPFLAYALSRCPNARFAAECDYEPALDWMAGVLGLVGWLLFAGLLLAVRRPAPTIFCAGCDGMGWIADLVPTGGACPRCGRDEFDHRTFTSLGEAQPLVVDWERVPGAELLRRRGAGTAG
jgi:hypothetical protein